VYLEVSQALGRALSDTVVQAVWQALDHALGQALGRAGCQTFIRHWVKTAGVGTLAADQTDRA
jgi:hypothetical protein